MKKSGGRPRKYSTAEEAAAAKRRQNWGYYHNLSHSAVPSGLADFITYEPPLPSDVPTYTRPSIGLRTSPDIPIPPENNIVDDLEGELEPAPYPPQSTPRRYSTPTGLQEDPEIVREVAQIRAVEEVSTEDIEYDEEVTGQLEESAAHLDAAAVLQDLQLRYEDRRESSKTGSQHSDYAVQQFSDVGSAAHTPPAQSSSTRSSRRGSSFPAQRNTLLSWMKPITIVDSNPASPTSHASPSAAMSSPTPLSLQQPAGPVGVSPPNPASPQTVYNTQSRTSASPVPTRPEGTAFKLAKQLRKFKGCTHEQHTEADRRHEEHHRRPDVHSKCSSIPDITSLLKGNRNGGAPIPDVLRSSMFMKATDIQGVDCKAAFEGVSPEASPEDVNTRDEGLRPSLCMSSKHSTSRKNRQPQVSFDIDSTCCFPTSLRFARRGIEWLPKAHRILNLTGDIHFGLKVPGYTSRNNPSLRYVPLHKIPHYCFGSVIGMSGLLMFIFFPALHKESDHQHTSYLSKRDEQLWLDGILLPCITKVVKSSNILQDYPASSRVADLASTAISAESLTRKESAREQLVAHTIQPQYLEELWNLVVRTVDENPGFHRFQGATLFTNSKDTKLATSDANGLVEAYDCWKKQWLDAADPEFYNPDRTFVDIAKQVTSQDSALPYDQIPEDHEAEVFLWKKCCLDEHYKMRNVFNPDGSKAKGSPKRTVYSWATLRDSIGQTLLAVPQGHEAKDGLVYSQFYVKAKALFDSSKIYVFNNDSVENLALDPGYVRSLQQEGGGITFSKGVCEFAYIHSKKRAHANLMDGRWKSYGIREEHRITLTMMEEIYELWRQWDLYDADDAADTQSPLPYYIVPTVDFVGLIHAQMNKYCFLFEHVLAHTAKTYCLPETIIMVVALRALRFCYGSSILPRESLLYKDRWSVIRGGKTVVKEGLGMKNSIELSGFGWFEPKISWETWRLAAPHGENILVGNMLMHEEYKRRWRAVKDLRDVFIRFNQAAAWYEKYGLQDNPRLLEAWLEYLHVLTLEQFDADVWKAMHKISKQTKELRREGAKPPAEVRFCYRDMKRMFQVDPVTGEPGPPYMVTGNKMRFDKVMDLLNYLFLIDEQERPGWGSKPYRLILDKTMRMLEQRLGYRRAEDWLDDFLHLVRLTHWVLPYPSGNGLLSSTKSNQSQGLKRRMMWFSLVYADPAHAAVPFKHPPSTLHTLLGRARTWSFGRQRERQQEEPLWGTSQLLEALEAQGVTRTEQEEFWVVGRLSIGYQGHEPLWERGHPPRLKMLEEMKKKSLDELEEMMSGLSVELAAEPNAANNDAADDEVVLLEEVAAPIQRRAAANAGRSMMAQVERDRSILRQFTRTSDGSGATGVASSSVNSPAGAGITNGSSSFAPSDNQR